MSKPLIQRIRLLALLPFLLVAWAGQADDAPVFPPAAYGNQCVADTDTMRKDHMSLLNHQRDETVIEGIRGKPFSLVGCVNCHAQRDSSGQAIRIDAEGQFCESCHTYASVKIDCFTCHAALPEDKKIIGSTTPMLPAVAAVAAHYSTQQLRILQSHRVAKQ
ncbi:MAG: hypothetical protein AAF404_12705 [Pseudomonadota bacterium]